MEYLQGRGRFAVPGGAPRPALILLDLNLPGMDGRELLAAIKADAHLQSIPVVIVTTSHDPRDMAWTAQHGASGYHIKATDYTQFRDEIRQLIEYDRTTPSGLLRLAGERLRWTSGLLEDAALLDAPARLAKRLLSLCQLHGERTKAGFTLRISQEDLAGFLGVSRQVVNQCLQEWRGRGWVDLARGVVTVLDEAALRKAAQDG